MPINPLVSGLTSVAYLVCLLLITGVQAFYPAVTSTPVYTGTTSKLGDIVWYDSGEPMPYTSIAGSYSIVTGGSVSWTLTTRVFSTAGEMLATIPANTDNGLPSLVTENLVVYVTRDAQGTHRWSYQLTQSGSVFTFSTISSVASSSSAAKSVQAQKSTNYIFGGYSDNTYKVNVNSVGVDLALHTETANQDAPNRLISFDAQDMLIKCQNSEIGRAHV